MGMGRPRRGEDQLRLKRRYRRTAKNRSPLKSSWRPRNDTNDTKRNARAQGTIAIHRVKIVHRAIPSVFVSFVCFVS